MAATARVAAQAAVETVAPAGVETEAAVGVAAAMEAAVDRISPVCLNWTVRRRRVQFSFIRASSCACSVSNVARSTRGSAARVAHGTACHAPGRMATSWSRAGS